MVNGRRLKNVPALLHTYRGNERFAGVLEPRFHALVVGDTNTENIKIGNIAPLLRSYGGISFAHPPFTADELELRFLDPRAPPSRLAVASRTRDRRAHPASRASQSLFWVSALRSLGVFSSHVPDPAAFLAETVDGYLEQSRFLRNDARLPAPNRQQAAVHPMPPGHLGDIGAHNRALRDDARLLLRRPRAPLSASRDHLHPPIRLGFIHGFKPGIKPEGTSHRPLRVP
jgi:hypothetical protein